MSDSAIMQNRLPRFSEIKPENIQPTLKALLMNHREQLTQLLTHNHFTWDSLMAPLEEMEDELSKMWAPISHLHNVMESDVLRTVYSECLPLLTEYHTELLQNEALYQAICSLEESPSYHDLNDAQKKVIHNALRDFKLSGVHLSPEDKKRFLALQNELNQLSIQFSANVLDATHAFTLHITDENEINGLSKNGMQMAEANAKTAQKTGWILTLDFPMYSEAMKSLTHRDLRKKLYEAYATRASDQGPNAFTFDNTSIMENILKNRQALSKLLNYQTYADYSLATKMTHSTNDVLEFLNLLVKRSRQFAERELQTLTEFAYSLDGIQTLEIWDMAYYSEKLKQSQYAFSQEELRPYFPVPAVLNGLFQIVHQLFNIKIIERQNIDTWHPDVQYFEIYDHEDTLRGAFYIDLYARLNKREGAWMDECRVRRTLPNGDLQVPVAFLTCNFMPPFENKPSFLTHEDVETLFHEFGHCLHHLLTKVDYAPVSGINGVPWDAVEFPSQLLERWCFEKEVLQLISSKEGTGEPLPEDLYNKLIAAQFFQAGLQMMRQLEFALFDFKIHLDDHPEKPGRIQSILDEVREAVTVMKPPAFNRFQHCFSHIFAGGYAAGYYGYKWSEVLSCDAFELFKNKGIFNKTIGDHLLKTVLEKGGVYEPMDLFIAFRGRAPSIDALLKQNGLVENHS